MIKVQVKYSDDREKESVINALSKQLRITKVSKPLRTGKYNRIYIDVK